MSVPPPGGAVPAVYWTDMSPLASLMKTCGVGPSPVPLTAADPMPPESDR